MTQNKFNIVRILSDTEFIIDGGSNDGIESGQKFKIIDPNSNPINGTDGEIIGYLGAEKNTLHAYDVRDTFSVLRTNYVPAVMDSHYRQQTAIMSKMALKTLQSLTDIPAHYEPANVNPDDIEPIESSTDPIQKGDIAVMI